MKTFNYVIEDYISNHKALTEKLLNSTTNIYLHKSDTGMGGSSVFLEVKGQKIILVQPLTGMIEGKYIQYSDNPNIYFVHKGSKHHLKSALDRIHAINEGVICTTAESLIAYNDKNGIDYLKEFTLVIDESDCYSTTTYRGEAFYQLYRLISNKSFNRVIATTATPLHNYIDMPFGIIDEVFKVSRKNEREKTISINNHFNINEIIRHVNEKEKVVIFTNEVKNYKQILNNNGLSDKIIQCLTSKGINPKINIGTERTQEEIVFESLNEDASIYILSSKYLIGFDMSIDANVYIISDNSGMYKHEAKHYNEIIQAYGRIRKNVISATLIINGPSQPYNLKLINDLYSTKMTEDQYKVFLNEINNQLLCDTFDIDILTKRLSDVGFYVKNICDSNFEKISKKCESLEKRLANLYVEQSNTIDTHINTILLNMEGDMDTDTSFSFSIACDYAISAYMHQTNDVSLLTDKRLQVDRVINKIYNNTEVLDSLGKNEREIIKTAYFVYNFDDNIVKYNKANMMKAYDIADKVIHKCVMKGLESVKTNEKRVPIPGTRNMTTLPLEFKVDKEWIKVNQFINIDHNYLYVNVERDVKTAIKKFDSEIIKKTIEKVKDIIKELSKIKNYDQANYLATYNMLSLSLKNQKKNYINYLKYLLVKTTTNNPVNFRITNKDGRQYNPLTKVAGCLRDIIPTNNHQLLDIQSANPTFIDYVTNDNISGEVYQNIMNNTGCTRKEAKVKYNTMLNTINLPYHKYNTFFREICNYSEKSANIITEFMLKPENNVKGGMFRSMVKIEKRAIDLIIKDLDITNYTRLHDAIMIHDTIERDLSRVITDGYIKIMLHKEF